VTFAADYLRLDLSALPLSSPEFGAGFYLGTGNNKKPLLLVAPGAGNSVVPHVRYAADLVLTLADGTVVKELGQLVVTSGLVVRSRDGQFELHVTSVIGSLDDDGMLTFGASLADLLNALTPESRSLMNPYPGSF